MLLLNMIQDRKYPLSRIFHFLDVLSTLSVMTLDFAGSDSHSQRLRSAAAQDLPRCFAAQRFFQTVQISADLGLHSLAVIPLIYSFRLDLY